MRRGFKVCKRKVFVVRLLNIFSLKFVKVGYNFTETNSKNKVAGFTSATIYKVAGCVSIAKEINKNLLIFTLNKGNDLKNGKRSENLLITLLKHHSQARNSAGIPERSAKN